MKSALVHEGCSLFAPEVRAVLDRLHGQAERQRSIFLKIAVGWGIDARLRRKPSVLNDEPAPGAAR